MIKSFFNLITKGLALPKVEISLKGSNRSHEIFQHFNSRHPKFPLLKRKTIGAELIDLKSFTDFEAYVRSVSGKNSASYFSRRCLKNKFWFAHINPDDHLKDIYEINKSLPFRQGREMEDEYITQKTTYKQAGDWDYLGIFNKEAKLVAYLFLENVGDLTYVGPVLGHGQYLKDGIMYLLFTEAIRTLIHKNKARYFMYDMYFGATDGLKLFKNRIGFKPHRVKWIING